MVDIKASERSNDIESAQLPPSLSLARRHLVQNILSNVAYQVAHIAVSLWMTPFLISYLGIAAFGMIPLVSTLTSYMGILTTSLNSAFSRFLAIDLGNSNDEEANKTFNTSLFGVIGIIIALTPVAVVISLIFSDLFQVPVGWENDASWLSAIIAVSFFVSAISGILSLSPFIHSKFFSSNIVSFAGLLARVGLVFGLFTAFRAHLWYAGGGMLIGGLVSLFGYIFLWRKITPQLHIKLSDFDRSRLRSLTGMGGWVLVNELGALLLSKVDLIVVNAYYGSTLTGGYGAVIQLSVLIETLVTTASTVVRPVILLKYTQGDFLGLQDVAYRSVKLIGLALALPVGLMCGMAQPLLSIWLGPSFTYLRLLLIILVCHQSLSLSVRPLLYINNAYNKVQWPCIVTLISGAASVTADLIVAHFGLWGYLGIAGSTTLIWTLKNVFYTPIYTSHIMKQPWRASLVNLVPTLIGTLFVAFAGYGLTLLRMPGNLLELAGSAAIITLFYAACVWSIGLNQGDRKLLRDLLPWNKRQVQVSILK